RCADGTPISLGPCCMPRRSQRSNVVGGGRGRIRSPPSRSNSLGDRRLGLGSPLLEEVLFFPVRFVCRWEVIPYGPEFRARGRENRGHFSAAASSLSGA